LVAGDGGAAGETGDRGVDLELLQYPVDRLHHPIVGGRTGGRRGALDQQLQRRQVVVAGGQRIRDQHLGLVVVLARFVDAGQRRCGRRRRGRGGRGLRARAPGGRRRRVLLGVVVAGRCRAPARGLLGGRGAARRIEGAGGGQRIAVGGVRGRCAPARPSPGGRARGRFGVVAGHLLVEVEALGHQVRVGVLAGQRLAVELLLARLVEVGRAACRA